MLDGRHGTRRRLIAKCFSCFATNVGIGRLFHEFGKRGDRLRRLHLANGLGGLGADVGISVGASEPQQHLHRTRIVMVRETFKRPRRGSLPAVTTPPAR